MGKNQYFVLPTSDSDTELSNRFSDFFQGKIQTIKDNLQKPNETNDNVVNVLRADVKFTGQHLTRLAPASSNEIKKLLVKSPSKSCELDPMPTYLLKQYVNNVLPVITTMVNKSLNEMSVPTAFKQVIVKPLLKKPGLDMNNLKNYRPVSNHICVSKIIEKVVASRIEDHLDKHKLHDNRQSAYRSFHSTETALLREHHNIAAALDNNSCYILVMLDLSAAFDVINHVILYQRLEYTFGISGSALA